MLMRQLTERHASWGASETDRPLTLTGGPLGNAGSSGKKETHMESDTPAQSAAKHKRPTVAIADDHLLMAEGLAKLVEPDFEVVAKVDHGRELLRIASQTPPDVALIDVSMPELTGMETTRELLKLAPA